MRDELRPTVARTPLTEVVRARVTKTTKDEIAAEQKWDRRTSESDQVRVLIEEALTARARNRRR